jgi:transcriptional regulator with XRE-family HTH domain
METPESMVARNVAELREQRGLTVRALSAKLGELGRPILPSGITKIENQTRGVSVGDLIALSIALRVNPNRLMIGIDDPFGVIALTPAVEGMQLFVWPWLRGERPLWSSYPASETDAKAIEDDFVRHSQEVHQRLRDDHTAVRTAKAVLWGIRSLLDQWNEPGDRRNDREDVIPKSIKTTPARLRRAVTLLVAAVDDLIGDDDGER